MNITDLSLLTDFQSRITLIAHNLQEDDTYRKEVAISELLMVARDIHQMLEFDMAIEGSTSVQPTYALSRKE